MIRLCVFLLCLMAATCSRPSDAPPVTTPPVSGLDPESIDRNVRPQDDLFHHVNGAWLAKTEIPSDKASYGAFDILFDKAQADLRTIVEDAGKSASKTPGSEAQKIGDFYESFMNEARVEELGLAPMKTELDAIDALQTKTELARHFAHFFKLNLINPVIGYVDGDAQQPTHDILYVYQGGLGLPDRDYYLKNDDKLREYREKYVAFLTTILKFAGDATPEKSAREIFVLEMRLARAHWTNVENRDAVKTYNKVTVADLAKQFPGFDWTAWTTELGVSGIPAVVVNQPSYLKALAATVSELPVDAWKPYLKASLLNGFAPYLNKAIVDAEFGFYNTILRGVKEQQPRWKRAVNTLNGNMGEMLGKLYVEKHFKPEAKARMEALVGNLREAYRLGIDKLEWMGAETKKEAQAKLAKFNPKIGYPNKWRDYSKLEIRKDDLAGNVMRAFLNENTYQLGKAGKPIDPEQWGMTPQTVNAYYNPVRNEIVFPAAILQPPFFNLEADDAVNYGGIGAVIGHEMGHGFDDQGRRFDATGALRDWWTKTDETEYQKRAKVLIDQFNEFEPLPGLHVNGALTLGENIADLTGLVIAYEAYKLSLKGVPAPVIDGVPAEQRFYMGWAQSWKAKEREESLRQQVLTNVHSPEMYRANGPVRNIPEFYAAFGVKEGDKMFIAPERRVKIW
ncbi:MAG TPA: M13-type metalloendopeptidase [Vicinamibacterales bacterium]